MSKTNPGAAVELEKILLIVRADDPCLGQIKLAMKLAQAHGAEVEALCLMVERISSADSAAVNVKAAFDRIAGEHAIRTSWSMGALGDERLQAARARTADLVAIRNPGPGDPDGRMDLASLVVATGTPCLVIPDWSGTLSSFDRVVVAWNGSREAKRAVDDALVFLRRASAVQVLSVGNQNSMELSLTEIHHHLARHGVVAETAHRQRRRGVGRVILSACAAFDADLLVMGAYGHSPLTEALLSGATFTALADAKVPLLLSH